MAKQTTIPKMRPGRVPMRQADIAQFVVDKGSWVWWEKAILCPCVNLETLTPDPSHELCARDYGRLYEPPVKVLVLVTNQDWSKAFMMGFPSSHGTIAFSFPGYREDRQSKEASIGEASMPGEYDRITLIDQAVCITDEHLIVGDETKTGLSMEVTRFRNVQELIRVTSLSSDRLDIVNHIIGTDVQIVDDSRGDRRQIRWIEGGNSPEVGATYTLRYLATPEFLIREIEPRMRRSSENQLPPFVRAYRVDQVKPAT